MCFIRAIAEPLNVTPTSFSGPTMMNEGQLFNLYLLIFAILFSISYGIQAVIHKVRKLETTPNVRKKRAIRSVIWVLLFMFAMWIYSFMIRSR